MSGLEQASLTSERAEVRRGIASRVVYKQLMVADERRAFVFEHADNTRTIVLNFAAGTDFHPGAEHWFEMRMEAQGVLSHVMNAVSWLSNAKHAVSAKDGHTVDMETTRPVRFDVHYTLEVIPSEPAPPVDDDAEEREGERRCAGYRLWIDITPLPPSEAAAAILQMNVDGGGGAGGDDGAAPRPPTALQLRKAAELARNCKRWKESPLAMGAELSIGEAAGLAKMAGTIRARIKKGNGQKPDVPEPSSLRPYRFAAFLSSEMAHLAGVVPFMHTHEHADMPEDPFDDFLHVDDGSGNRGNAATSRKSLFNLDAILTKERAMVYKTQGGDYDWSVRHCRLDSYIAGAHGHGNTREGRVGMREYLEAFQDEYRPSVLDTGRRVYPTPALVYTVAHIATVAEIFLPFVRLPWAVGSVLPAAALSPPVGGDADVPMLLPDSDKSIEELERQLDAIVRLRDIEATQGDVSYTPSELTELSKTRVSETEAQRRRIVPGTFLTQPVDIVVPTLAQAQRRLEALHTPRHSQSIDEGELNAVTELLRGMDDEDDPPAAAAPQHRARTTLAPVHRRTLEEQRTFVMTHFHRISKEFCSRTYDEFNVDAHRLLPWSSTHTTLGIDDLIRSQRNVDDGQYETRILNQLNAQANASATPQVPITTEMKARVMDCVDVIPRTFVERNAFLAERARKQINRNILKERHKAERALLPEGAELHAATKAQAKQHAQEIDALQRAAWEGHLALVRKTENAPEAFLTARNYAVQHLMNASTRDTDIGTLIDASGLAHVHQFVVDSFAAIDPVSVQNMPYLMRGFLCGFHAHRYAPNRGDPATNYLIAGSTGTGKSYLLKRIAFYALEGIVQQVTVATTASYNVAKDFDHQMILQEEMEYDLLVRAGANEKGNSDKLNYTKARMTSFCTWTQYYFSNKDTGQREAHTCVSSQHVVMLAATNQPLDNMDEPMKRRMIIDFVFEISAQTDGGKANDNERFSLLLGSDYGKYVQHKHHELHWMFMVVETAIRSAVIDDVLDDGARLHLRCILAEAERSHQIVTSHKTRSHWVLEISRTLAILDACYTALYSAEYNFLYDSGESDIRRWSASMFHLLVTPALKIRKDHVALAVETFDFFYASRDDQRLLGTLAETVCHMSQPDQWQFRRVPGGGAGGFQNDPNYLVVTGPSDMKIAERVSEAHKNIAQPRAEDIIAIFRPYSTVVYESRGLESVPGVDGRAVGVRASTTAPVAARRALFFEFDASNMSTTRTVRQLCVSFELIARRFGISFETATAASVHETLVPEPRILNGKHFADDAHGGSDARRSKGMAAAAALAQCPDSRAPMVAPIRTTLSHKTLEKSPYEHAHLLPVPDACYRLSTFYTPDDVRVSYDSKQLPLRVPQHGTVQIMQLRRDPQQANLRYDNYARPLPTARASIFGGQQSSAEGGADMSRGFVSDHYDIDFDMSVAQMRKYGHPGVPLLEAIFIRACREAAGDDWAMLLEDVPELSKLVRAHETNSNDVTPLPFCFAPIAYRIKNHVRRQQLARLGRADISTPAYSAENIFARVQDSVVRHLAKRNETDGTYDGYTKKIGHDELFTDPVYRPEGYAGTKRSRDAAGFHEGDPESGNGGRHRARARRTPAVPDTSDPDAMDIDEPAS